MTDYRAALKNAVSQATQEWQENKRLQMFALLGVVLFLFWGHMALDERREEAKKGAMQAFAELQDREAVASEKAWIARAKEVESIAAEAKKMIWLATGEGEAEALIRDWISAQAKRLGLQTDRVSVELASGITNKNYRPVRVEMQGQYEPGVWQRFVASIAQNQPRFVIELDEINLSNKRKLHFRLGITAWFKIRNPGKSSDEGGAS